MSVSAVCSERIVVELPVRNEKKGIWDSFNVVWLESFDGNPFLVKAKLPAGWSVYEQIREYNDQRNFTILDAQRMPKALVRIKEAFHDQQATVIDYSEEDSEKLKHKYSLKPKQKKFEKLVSFYNTMVKNLLGLGSFGQQQIDQAYSNLKRFLDENPEYDIQLPPKFSCGDDQRFGKIGGMLTELNAITGNC